MTRGGSDPTGDQPTSGRRGRTIASLLVAVFAAVIYVGARRFYGPDVSGPLGAALALLVLALILFAAGGRSLQDTHDTSLKMLQAAVTVVALLVGAIWFLEERAHQPHATLDQVIDTSLIADGLVLMQVELNVKNEGKRLLKVTRPDFRLQHVSPPDLGLEGYRSWRSTEWPDNLYSRGELRWSQVRRFREPLEHEIEAGETDRLYVEYLVSCEHGVVKVSSAIEKPDGSGNQWKVKDIVDLRPACGGEAATKG